MAAKNRPMSPHLQIYKPQITSILSITHRITGVGMVVALVGLSWWLIAAAVDAEYFALVQSFAGSWFELAPRQWPGERSGRAYRLSGAGVDGGDDGPDLGHRHFMTAK